ncbi:MAG: purine-binding chemotaxis protein CheW [Chloroflexi bacterium]|nr:purine-binding chemotaxis protein CheW [Chloroflexota bacterium]
MGGDVRADWSRDTVPLLVFELIGQRYALAISHVREVLPRAALTRLPGAPPAVAGILRLRGALLPILDLRQRLGLPPAVPAVGHRIVVARVGSTTVGLLVDAVHGLTSANVAEGRNLQTPPGRLIRQLIETPAGAVAVLDADAICGAEVATFLSGVVEGWQVPHEG